MNVQQRKQFLTAMQGLIDTLSAELSGEESGQLQLDLAGSITTGKKQAQAAMARLETDVTTDERGVIPHFRLAAYIRESLDDPRDYLNAVMEGDIAAEYQGLRVLVSRLSEQLHYLNGDLNSLAGILKPVLQLPPPAAQSGGAVANDLPPTVGAVASCLAHVLHLREDVAVIASSLKL